MNKQVISSWISDSFTGNCQPGGHCGRECPIVFFRCQGAAEVGGGVAKHGGCHSDVQYLWLSFVLNPAAQKLFTDYEAKLARRWSVAAETIRLSNFWIRLSLPENPSRENLHGRISAPSRRCLRRSRKEAVLYFFTMFPISRLWKS